MHPSILLRYASEPPAMATVRTLLKNAMRSGNAMEKNVLRAVMAAVKTADIAKPDSVTNDVQFAGILNSLIKKRNQSIEQYVAGNRQDLADAEKEEITVLQQLVEKLDVSSPEQLKQLAKQYIEGLNLGSASDALKKAMSSLPKDVEAQWKAPRSDVARAVKDFLGQQKRGYATSAHDNPLGLRRRSKPAGGNSGSGGNVIHRHRLPNVKKIVLVSSAKGGVGKSTVAANLAYSLVQRGYSTGLLDIDIFGPSVPTMLGLSDAKEPRLNQSGDKLLPMVSHGLKAMSMGFLIPSGKSVSWRGLLVQKALQQLLFQVEWGPTDYLVVDMPPGTGDVQLTLGQQLVVDGAVLVSTPQQVALVDAERGLDLFKLLKIPVLGIVHNMAYFKCPCCNERTDIFGSSANEATLENLKEVPVLAEIPIERRIAVDADAGRFESSEHYLQLADAVAERLQ